MEISELLIIITIITLSVIVFLGDSDKKEENSKEKNASKRNRLKP